jgi:hypothetical protein
MTRYDLDDDAFDEHGILKDGRSYRVKMTARDADSLSALQRSVRSARRITDGNGNGGLGLHRPGFRRLADDTDVRDRRARMYEQYDVALERAYLMPTGFDDDYDLVANTPTHTEGLGRDLTDTRTLDQIARDHMAKMTKLYDQLDKELAEAWRQP